MVNLPDHLVREVVVNDVDGIGDSGRRYSLRHWKERGVEMGTRQMSTANYKEERGTNYRLQT